MKRREIIEKQSIEIARLSDVIVGLNARIKTQVESIMEYRKENEKLVKEGFEAAVENEKIRKILHNYDRFDFENVPLKSDKDKEVKILQNKWYLDGSIFDKCHKISEKYREANKNIILESEDQKKEIEMYEETMEKILLEKERLNDLVVGLSSRNKTQEESIKNFKEENDRLQDKCKNLEAINDWNERKIKSFEFYTNQNTRPQKISQLIDKKKEAINDMVMLKDSNPFNVEVQIMVKAIVSKCFHDIEQLKKLL